MAVLSDVDKQSLSSEIQSEISESREVLGGLTKSDFRAAINALDDWLNTNAATINAAIPQPARSVLTSQQKARLLARIITKRFIKGA